MEKKEVTGLPVRQGQRAAHHWKGAAVGTASLNIRCLKSEVEIWKTGQQFQMYSLKVASFFEDSALKKSS